LQQVKSSYDFGAVFESYLEKYKLS
jgi:hypothetical protein